VEAGTTPTTALAQSASAAESSGPYVSVEPEKTKLDWLIRRLPTARVLKKIVPLALMFFLILFNYTILRDTKDVLVVTASGAEVIPFLKTYVNLPSAIAFTILFTKLSNTMSREKLFYSMLSGFLAFFAAFGFFIYPNKALLHPTATMDAVSNLLPAVIGGRLAPILSIIKNWSFAAFYTMAELWGSIVVSLLFWGLANDVVTVDEAKRYYPLFSMLANVALVFSGQYVRYVSQLRANLGPGVDGWTVSLQYLMGAVAVCGSGIAGLFWFVDKFVRKDVSQADPLKAKKKKQKTKMGVAESFKFLASSSYIRNLATLVICYGMCINMVEVSWKSRLREAFPDPNDYSAFMGTFSSCTGIATFMMLIASRVIFDKFGWGVAALITPVVLLITGLGFFSLSTFQKEFAPFIAQMGTTPLKLAVLIGAVQNILSKGSKYSLFDPCKEMAYIPLDNESRTKGKAAIDVIGNPLGKSGGSFIQQMLIIAFGSLAASTPALAVILGGVILLWIKAARSLSVEFTEKNAAEEQERAERRAQEAKGWRPNSRPKEELEMEDEDRRKNEEIMERGKAAEEKKAAGTELTDEDMAKLEEYGRIREQERQKTKEREDEEEDDETGEANPRKVT